MRINASLPPAVTIGSARKLATEVQAADTSIQTRLDSIEQQIAEFRHKLDLKGIMNADHKVTEAELRERLKVLRNRLARQGDHAGMHREADALDLAFNRWVDGTDMEYKS